MKMYELEGSTTKQTDEERKNALPKSEYFESPRDHVEDPKPSSMSGIILVKFLHKLCFLSCINILKSKIQMLFNNTNVCV